MGYGSGLAEWFHMPCIESSNLSPATRKEVSIVANNTKLIGDISELMVQTELLKLGYNVLVPVGDRLPYDLCLDINNKLIRIQVRTAYFESRSNKYAGNVKTTKTNRKVYKTVMPKIEDTDFFVYVIQPLNIFYIFPTGEAIKRGSINFFPHRPAPKQKYNTEQFRNRWELLEKVN